MGLVVGFLIVGLVVAVAAVFVIREAGRLRADPPPPVFDVDEAFDWVIRRLPDIVAATLTDADVRRILTFQLEYLHRTGVSVNGTTAAPRGPILVGGREMVDYIVRRSEATGEAYIPEQVDGVLETQLTYLRAIGAVGPAADPGELPPDSAR